MFGLVYIYLYDDDDSCFHIYLYLQFMFKLFKCCLFMFSTSMHALFTRFTAL